MADDLIKKIQGVRTFRGKILPAWARRADERPDFRTKKNESVLSSSGEHNGKEILFPRIRMRGPGLEKMDFDTAKKEAIQRGDFLEFKNDKEGREAATRWSKAFSKHVGNIP